MARLKPHQNHPALCQNSAYLKRGFFVVSGCFFFFLKLNGCTESFLSSSLGKHLSLTFMRVTDTHQDKAAVHSHLPVSKRIIHSPQTYSWARKCANAILNPEATAKAKKNNKKKQTTKPCRLFDDCLSQAINTLHHSSWF